MSRVSSTFVSAACLLIGGLSATLAVAAPAGPLEPHAGTWLTADGSSKVKISPCGAASPAGQTYCATIVWLRPPVTARDQETYDSKKRFLGTNISSDLHRSTEDNLLVGSILNPESGKTYNAKVRLKNAAALEMGGCILGGLLCGSETWSRTGDEVVTAASTRPAKASGAKPAPRAAAGAPAPASDEE